MANILARLENNLTKLHINPRSRELLLSGICSCEKVGIMTTIEVGKFSRTPGGRYITDGPDSGQLFRQQVLLPALQEATAKNEKVTVVLDGPRGYLSSFIDEAFGGLVRQGNFSPEMLKRSLVIHAQDPFYDPYRLLALKYIAEASPNAATAAVASD